MYTCVPEMKFVGQGMTNEQETHVTNDIDIWTDLDIFKLYLCTTWHQWYW